MKKILFFLVISLVMIVGVVLADGAPPTFSYEVTVSKEGGTTIYLEQYLEADNKFHLIANGKLEYGTTVTLNDILNYNNESYARVWNESIVTNNGDKFGYVLLKDLKKKTPWKMSDFNFYDYEYEGMIIDPDGVEIYEWPSNVEKVIGIVPNKTKIKYKTIWEDYYWVYVTYNGTNGWVNRNDIWNMNENDKLLAKMKGSTLMDKEGNKLAEIPSGTSIKNFYIANEQQNYYINYNGTWGYADRNDFSFYYDDSSKYKYVVNYDNAILVGTDDEIISVPIGTVLEYSTSGGYSFRIDDDYYYASQIFTNYNGKDGWVFQLYNSSDDEYRQRENNKLQKVIEETKSFIENKKTNHGKVEETDTIVNKVETEKPKTESVLTQQEMIKTPARDESFSSIQMITICTLSAVAIALIAVVFIIMFNKSFNNKLLIIIIPITIVIIALCFVFVKSLKETEGEITARENVIEKTIDSGEEEKESETKREIYNLKTSYTKNFFNLSEYGSVSYSSDGKQFGYAEAYKSNEDRWKYNKEVTLNGKVKASSTLAPQGNFSYEAEHAVNGNRDNAWIEGVDGFGEGEYIEFTLKNDTSSNRKYKEICIVNGYAGNMKKWETNSRVKKLSFYYDDELYATIELFDTITPQYIDISTLNVETKANSEGKFKFVIDEVYEEDYPGVKYSDTAITGIMLGY